MSTSSHPSEIVNPGDEIEVVVLNINKDKQEISLGIKQTETNPWTRVAEKYPPNTVVEGTVRNLTNYGAFIEIEGNILTEKLVMAMDVEVLNARSRSSIAPTWARLTLLVGDARTRAGTRNVVRIDGRRVGEIVGSTQKKLKAGAIASTVIELSPAALLELSDGSAQVEISRDPGTGSDDIMIDYSRLEIAFGR